MPFSDWLTPALLVLVLLVTLWIAWRRGEASALRSLRDDIHTAVRGDVQQLERELRDEVARSALGTRQELSHNLATFQGMLLAQQGDVAQRQNEQIDSFRTQLAATQQHLADTLRQTTTTLAQQALGAREAQDASLGRSAELQANALQRFSDTLNEQLRALSQSNDQRMNEVRASVETKLAAIQTDNEKKLEQIRATVDEKLHATLEQRLGESFKQVADRLEQVHRGLGEMQTLARDVGSLSRVLNNVKTRGIFGEVQLRGAARAGADARAVRPQRRDDPGQQRTRRFRDPAARPARGRQADVAADRLQVPARRLRAPARSAGERRQGRRRSGRQGDRDAAAQRGALDPREVHRDAAHDRLRHPVRADRGPVCRGAAPPRPGRGAAARPSHHRSPARPPCWRP